MTTSNEVAFIGGGNMARSLIGGLIARGATPASMRVAEAVDGQRAALHRDFGVPVFATAAEAASGAPVWVLAVKPQAMRSVCAELAELAKARRPLAISIAAGVTTAQLARWLHAGDRAAIVRTMPNTPALLGAGITGLFASAGVDAAQRAQAERLLAAVGTTVWIEHEALMDAVTAVSGSGPAYAFMLAEAMQAAGEAQGLPAATARTLATQTLLGAARMLVESGEAPAVLRARVTSPGGTTEAAIQTLQDGGFPALVDRAVAAATGRGRQLSAAID